MTLETLSLCQALIEKPSVSPNDAGCQVLIADHLKNWGFQVQDLPFGNVQNLWATHGQGAPLFVFAGHTDVVPPGQESAWKSAPFSPTIRDNVLYGRGVADMKGSLAAMLVATQRFLNANPEHGGTLGFLITSDEEGDAIDGTQKVMEYLQKKGVHIDHCLVGEPTCVQHLGDTLKNGRRGSLTGRLTLFGHQGHVAYPHLAKNPIHGALAPLHALAAHTWDSGTQNFPPTGFQITNIASGVGASNVIPGELRCEFNFRFNTLHTPESLQQQVEKVLQSFDMPFEIQWRLSARPFLTTPSRLTEITQQAIHAVTGQTPTLSTTGGSSDARFIAPTGTEVIEFGLLNHNIHQVNESCSIEDLNALTDIYSKILKEFYATLF